MTTIEESGQMALEIAEEELEFALRVVPLADIAHIETPVPPKRELVESIRLIGMLQPPIFREDADGHLDIVVGRRRLAAARLAGMEEMTIFVAKTSAALADVMTLAENAIRSANTVTEFDAIERLTKRGFDIRAIRALTGMAIGTIKKRQGLLRLAPELAEAFRAGKMTATVADGAAKQPTAVQKELALALVAKGKITANDLHEVRQARSQASMQSALFDGLDEESPDGALDDPIAIGSTEYALAVDLQAVIDRMPATYDAWIAELRAIATGLMAIATGDKVPSQYDIKIDPKIAEWVDKDVRMWRGAEIVREIDPKYADAPVAQPERVFTVTGIPEEAQERMLAMSERKVSKPRKRKVEPIVDDTMTDVKNRELMDEEDEFIASLVR